MYSTLFSVQKDRHWYFVYIIIVQGPEGYTLALNAYIRRTLCCTLYNVRSTYIDNERTSYISTDIVLYEYMFKTTYKLNVFTVYNVQKNRHWFCCKKHTVL